MEGVEAGPPGAGDGFGADQRGAGLMGARAQAAGSYRFSPEERPVFPGAPYSPRHPASHRIVYAASALVMTMAGGLSNSLITVNLLTIGGNIGLYAGGASLLLAVYVAFNATANLLLVKARIQFGIPLSMHVLVGALVLLNLFAILVPSSATSLVARALSGIVAGGLTTLTLYNLFQVFPLAHRPKALIIGFSLPQLSVPVARLFPVDAIAFNHWQGLHLVEAATGLAAWTMLMLMPLPPTERSKAFEPLDAVTIALAIPAMLLISIVLAEGRLLWWTDAPQLGWALAAALPLLAALIFLEDRRARPLLWVRWYAKRDIAVFALIVLVVRIALAEQTYGAVGLLALHGLTNDQLHPLFLAVLAAMLAGTAIAALLARPDRLLWLAAAAAALIALGAWLDTHLTTDSRPQQLFVSQSLLGFGSSLFLGPALLFGLARMLREGSNYLVSFVVMFSTVQNLGGLFGSAVLGSIQTARARVHAEALADALSLADPAVVARLQQGAGAVARELPDPAVRAAEGSAALGQALQLQANVLAFNDTFRVVALIALVTAVVLAGLAVHARLARQ